MLTQEKVEAATGGVLPATLLKEGIWHGHFPVKFARFLRSPFLQNTSELRLLER